MGRTVKKVYHRIMNRRLRLILEAMRNQRVIKRIHDDLDRVKDRIEDLIYDGVSCHSEGSDVFHVCEDCDRFEEIHENNLREGHGGKQLCLRCLAIICEEEC